MEDITLQYILIKQYISSSVPTTTIVTLSGYIYRLKFYGNPGAFKQPEIEVHLKGNRPSLLSSNKKKIITKVWTDGDDIDFDDLSLDNNTQTSENIDLDNKMKTVHSLISAKVYPTTTTTTTTSSSTKGKGDKAD